MQLLNFVICPERSVRVNRRKNVLWLPTSPLAAELAIGARVIFAFQASINTTV